MNEFIDVELGKTIKIGDKFYTLYVDVTFEKEDIGKSLVRLDLSACEANDPDYNKLLWDVIEISEDTITKEQDGVLALKNIIEETVEIFIRKLKINIKDGQNVFSSELMKMMEGNGWYDASIKNLNLAVENIEPNTYKYEEMKNWKHEIEIGEDWDRVKFFQDMMKKNKEGIE